EVFYDTGNLSHMSVSGMAVQRIVARAKMELSVLRHVLFCDSAVGHRSGTDKGQIYTKMPDQRILLVLADSPNSEDLDDHFYRRIIFSGGESFSRFKNVWKHVWRFKNT